MAIKLSSDFRPCEC